MVIHQDRLRSSRYEDLIGLERTGMTDSNLRPPGQYNTRKSPLCHLMKSSDSINHMPVPGVALKSGVVNWTSDKHSVICDLQIGW